MKLPTTLLNACIAIAFLAGCLDPTRSVDAPEPAPVTSPQPFPDADRVPSSSYETVEPNALRESAMATTIPWALDACKTVIAAMPVQAERLASILPAGFVPLTPEELLGVPDARGDAVLMLLIQQCERAVGPAGEALDVASGDFHIPVRQPTGFDVAADLHALRLDLLVADANLRGLLLESGAKAFEGTVSFIEDGPVASWRHVRATMNLSGSLYVVEGMPAAPVTGKEDFTYAAYSPLGQGGFGVWTSRILNLDFTVGEGHAELPPGWARDVVGTDTYYLPYVLHMVQSHVEASLVLQSAS